MVYIKKVLFGSDLTALQTGVMYIPTINVTRDEFNSAWNNLGNVSLDDVISFLNSYGLSESGFPAYDPGAFTEHPSIRDYDNFNKYLQCSQYSTFKDGVASTSTSVYYVDEYGSGLMIQGGRLYVIDGYGSTSIGGITRTAHFLGITGRDDTVFTTIIFQTSNNIIGALRIGYNKNNSGLTFIGTNESRRVISVIQHLPDAEIGGDDPYEPGGESGTGGGTGTFSETGDIVGIPSLPTLSAVDTGFITLFNPTAAQVKQLASYMWSSGFDLDTFRNIVANPIDCILGLTIVPVDPLNAGTKAVTVGNIPTPVNMPYLSTQYVEVDCGTLNVVEFWGSYLDYSPYTKMSLYLPYIGIVPIDIDDVMNATITVKYHVDVLSGACVAYVLCNGTQLYTYIGQCSSNVPITSNDFTNTVNGILGIAGNIGSLVSSGGKTGSVISAAANIASNAINAIKPNVQKSGAMSGTGGLMGVQTPYLICQRPRQSLPANQNTFTGYPSNITLKLGDLSGYTEIERIHLEGVPCTNEEMDEIMTLLESGVYI